MYSFIYIRSLIKKNVKQKSNTKLIKKLENFTRNFKKKKSLNYKFLRTHFAKYN